MSVSELPGARSGIPGARVDSPAAAVPFPPMPAAAGTGAPGDVVRRLPEIDLEARYQLALIEIDYFELGDLISPVEARRRRRAAYLSFTREAADLRSWLGGDGMTVTG